MSKRLESYLEEISHYLGTNKEKQEILTEIESHLIEKTEWVNLNYWQSTS